MIDAGVKLPALADCTTIPSRSARTVTVDCTGATAKVKVRSGFEPGRTSIDFVKLWNSFADATAVYCPGCTLANVKWPVVSEAASIAAVPPVLISETRASGIDLPCVSVTVPEIGTGPGLFWEKIDWAKSTPVMSTKTDNGFLKVSSSLWRRAA